MWRHALSQRQKSCTTLKFSCIWRPRMKADWFALTSAGTKGCNRVARALEISFPTEYVNQAYGPVVSKPLRHVRFV